MQNFARELRYKRVQHFNEAGQPHFLTFSCYQRLPLLTNDLWRAWLAEAIRSACDEHTMALWAYVFMPEHVHVLLCPKTPDYSIAAWLHSAKTGPAKRIAAALKREQSELLPKLLVRTGGRVLCRFWQDGPGYDLNIKTMDQAAEKAQYCHRNPVKRGLVRSPDLWRWSSFRWLEQGRHDGEPLSLDDWSA